MKHQALHVNVAFDAESGAVLARQSWTGDYTSQVAFAAVQPARGFLFGRSDAISGSQGFASHVRPRLGRAQPGQSHRSRASIRAAALQVPVTIEPGRPGDVFSCWARPERWKTARDVDPALSDPAAVEHALRTRHATGGIQTLGTLQVRTPVLSVDLLLNRWLQYQALSCRFWGTFRAVSIERRLRIPRSVAGFDGVLYTAPDVDPAAYSDCRGAPVHGRRRPALVACGNRRWACEPAAPTICCGCPAVVAHYVKITGDHGILDEEMPFLEGPELARSANRNACSLRGLLLNRSVVGALQPRLAACLAARSARPAAIRNRRLERRHESRRHRRQAAKASGSPGSLRSTLTAFSDVGGEPRFRALRRSWRKQAENLAAAISNSAWDGEWYLRGFFDNGAPLGSQLNSEARIDSIAAILGGDLRSRGSARARSAMESARAHAGR